MNLGITVERKPIRNSSDPMTVETLREMVGQHFLGLEKGVDQHNADTALRIDRQSIEFDSKLRDSDTRYQQRFEAQEKALAAALTAADKAVTAALTAAKQLVDVALAAADKAVSKAEVASEKRFEGVNEFRKSLSDQTNTFIPRSESNVVVSAIESRLAKLERSSSILEGVGTQKVQGGAAAMWAVGLMVSLAMLAATLLLVFIKH